LVILIRSFVFVFLFSLGLYIFYGQVFSGFPSDIGAHIRHVNRIMEGDELNVAYPLWHFLVYYCSKLINITVKEGAVLVTAINLVLIGLVIFSITKHYLTKLNLGFTDRQTDILLLAISVVLIISTAVYVPFFNENQYVGQIHSGVWHNVTLLIVKPFALLSFFFTVLYFDNRSLRTGFVAVLVTLLSIYAKPSYIIVFLPTLFIFYVISLVRQANIKTLNTSFGFTDSIKKYKHQLIFLFILSLLSITLLWHQYTNVYSDSNESKIIVDFMGVWSLYTPNAMGSIIVSYLFPLAVLFLVPSKTSNAYLLALLLNIVSVLMFALFAESGPRYEHGNFGWSQQIVIQILFLVSIVELIKKYNVLSSWRLYILSITLSLHVVSGVFYVIKISKGLSYL